MYVEDEMSLDDFMSSEFKNSFVIHGKIRVYVRKGVRYIGRVQKKTIDIGNLINIVTPNRKDNFEIVQNPTSTGELRSLILTCERLAVQYNKDGIYVECVHNEFLPGKLIQYGFEKLDEPDNISAPNFYKELKK